MKRSASICKREKIGPVRDSNSHFQNEVKAAEDSRFRLEWGCSIPLPREGKIESPHVVSYKVDEILPL
jgi:hypothetical protein